MHILITGAAGMLGQKLVQAVAANLSLLGGHVSRLTLADVIQPTVPSSISGISTTLALDLSENGAAERAVDGLPSIIFHLAAIVSGEAEQDFEKGYRINLDGTRMLLEAIRARGLGEPYCPRVLFASSIAVFGAPFPEQIDDEFLSAPLTSYGTQKAICELLLSDYSRRGVFNGVGMRLPTICIRPGLPNKAASGFFSNILREPLAGNEAVLPVSENVRHWFASPRAAIGFFVHAAKLDLAELGPRRNLNMPGLSATVAEEIEALRHTGGEKAVSLIRREPDARIEKIVAGWPSQFDTARAQALGFAAEKSFKQIIRAHLEDQQEAEA